MPTNRCKIPPILKEVSVISSSCLGGIFMNVRCLLNTPRNFLGVFYTYTFSAYIDILYEEDLIWKASVPEVANHTNCLCPYASPFSIGAFAHLSLSLVILTYSSLFNVMTWPQNFVKSGSMLVG
jgi:hypothetical protein